MRGRQLVLAASAAVVVITTVLAVAGACSSLQFGGSSGGGDAFAPSAPPSERFVARVSVRCARATRRFDRVPVPTTTRERAVTSAMTSRRLARHRRALRRVRAPAEVREAWTRLQRELASAQEFYDRLARAARRGDAGSVAGFIRLLDREFARLSALASELGLPRCMPLPPSRR